MKNQTHPTVEMRKTLEIHSKLIELDDLARDKFPALRDFDYTVDTKLRGRVAGYMVTDVDGSYTLRFNLHLAMENENFIERTVVHEYAHMLVSMLEWSNPNVKSHGREWKYVMRMMGAKDASRCHSYKGVQRARKSTRYVYKCSACGETMELGATRHNRQVARQKKEGTSKYLHSLCRAPLLFTGRSVEVK